MKTETVYKIKTIRVSLKLEGNPETVKDPESVLPIAKAIFDKLDHDQEHFVILALDKANTIRGFKVVHTGGISECPVIPETVFRYALLMGGTAIIAVHNHPSGRIEPSPEDLNITKKLSAAGAVLGVKLLDHLILGSGVYFSFSERGLI